MPVIAAPSLPEDLPLLTLSPPVNPTPFSFGQCVPERIFFTSLVGHIKARICLPFLLPGDHSPFSTLFPLP
jgi:hypothetical protein